MGKLGGALLCLLFAIPFGGVGAWATWSIGTTVADAVRARDWVRVRATVEEAALTSNGDTQRADGRYRYVFQGKPYTGTRLGLSRSGGSDNIDDWPERVAAALSAAREGGQGVSVWVNPDNPAEAVFDREIRWGELVFLLPFSLAFGGVGVGALVVMGVILFGSSAPGQGAQEAIAKRLGGKAASGGKPGEASPAFLWVFAFFWNALSFPIAILVVRDVMASGEWAGLFVLLFPLVGLGLAWGAAAMSWNAWKARRGVAGVPTKAGATAPGRVASRAARTLFDPQAAGARSRDGALAASREPDIPPSVAEIEESGGTLNLRFAGRRRLGLAAMLMAIGLVFTGVAVAVFLADGLGVTAVVFLAIGTMMDLGAVSVVVGRLEVAVRTGSLRVAQRGLFGRREWDLSARQVSAIRPSLAYSLNDKPYFSLQADTDGGPVPLGNGIPESDLAWAVARRIGRALGIAPSAVQAPPAFQARPIPE